MRRFAAGEGVSRTIGEGKAFIVSALEGAMFETNATGCEIFDLAAAGRWEDEIVAYLAAAHPDVPRSEIERDVRETLDEYVKARLLTPS